jgi:hypothetical protein
MRLSMPPIPTPQLKNHHSSYLGRLLLLLLQLGSALFAELLVLVQVLLQAPAAGCMYREMTVSKPTPNE